jgi:hypothetical protein
VRAIFGIKPGRIPGGENGMGDFADRQEDEEPREDGFENGPDLEVRRCLHCGKPLVGKLNPRRLYCDDACKKAAYKNRYRARKKVEKYKTEFALRFPESVTDLGRPQTRRKGSWRMQMMKVWIISGFVVVIALMILMIVLEWMARGG